MVDLLIVGAGPAGLATALYAERAGLSCLVTDPRPPPIDKACGEGLMPGAADELRRLGVTVAGRPFRGIRYVSDGRSAEARFAGAPGIGMRRTVLHAALVRAVAARGIEIRRQPVTDFVQTGDRIVADGVCARFLVGADGLHSAIRRRAGLAGAAVRGRNRRWGQRCHFRLAPWTDLVEVHWSGSACAEAYVTPLDAGWVGVAVLGSVRRPLGEQLAAFPRLAGRLAGAEHGSVVGAGPLLQRVTGRRAGRVLLVGDAAGYVDALTGQGIGVALRTARALVDCVAGGRPEQYEAAWRAACRRYRVLTGGLLAAASRPGLRRGIVPAASHLPGVFSGAVRLLAGE